MVFENVKNLGNDLVVGENGGGDGRMGGMGWNHGTGRINKR